MVDAMAQSSGASMGASTTDQQERSINGNEKADYGPRPKRIACILCRRRKLKCDGHRPRCGTCSRLGHDCEYDEVRKKSGPKRGYVKQLEARLAQVETLLQSQDPPEKHSAAVGEGSNASHHLPNFSNAQPIDPLAGALPDTIPDIGVDTSMLDSQLGFMDDPLLTMNNDFSWEMISLGVEEPLPDSDIMDELNGIYFRKIHPSAPMIHRGNFYAALSLSPHMRPPICLRYAMWTLVASLTPKYRSAEQHFYARARKYAESDEMKGIGENMLTLYHAQCWSLIALYEFKTMYFPRSWQSVGRATRLCQMEGLHRLDGGGMDVKECLPEARHWTDREERRRTFWVAFCHDRYASVGTGWPMSIDEKDILTALPSSEEAFEKGVAEQTPTLKDALNGTGQAEISPFGGVCLLACVIGRNLHHLHRTDPQEDTEDPDSPYWKRHRALDNIILNTALSLPASLRLPDALPDANAVYTNLNIHTATICLHQAAIYRAEKSRLRTSISPESKRRCIVAAEQTTQIMKMLSSLDLTACNPFLCFSVFVAARVFIQYLKTVRHDDRAKSSLQFLLAALKALKHSSPLSESFQTQVEVDLEGSGLPGFTQNVQVDEMTPALHHMHMQDTTFGCTPNFFRQEDQRIKKGAAPKMIDVLTGAGLPDTDHRRPESHGQVRHYTTRIGSSDNHFFVQENSISPGTGFASDPSQTTSDHPTPSTLSHRESSNTSTCSPSIGGNTNASLKMTDASFPLFQPTSTSRIVNESSLPFGQQSNNLSFGIEQSWNVQYSADLTHKQSTEATWSSQMQQMDGANWGDWAGAEHANI